MGYKEWRERVLNRIDSTADRWEAEAKAKGAEVRRKSEEQRVRRADVESAAELQMLEHLGRMSGVDHLEMMRRAESVGIGGPDVSGVVSRTKLRAWVASNWWLNPLTPIGEEGSDTPLDWYRAWVSAVQVEERWQSREAEGVPHPAIERVARRLAKRYRSR